MEKVYEVFVDVVQPRRQALVFDYSVEGNWQGQIRVLVLVFQFSPPSAARFQDIV
jgi:hypothetical protein